MGQRPTLSSLGARIFDIPKVAAGPSENSRNRPLVGGHYGSLAAIGQGGTAGSGGVLAIWVRAFRSSRRAPTSGRVFGQFSHVDTGGACQTSLVAYGAVGDRFRRRDGQVSASETMSKSQPLWERGPGCE